MIPGGLLYSSNHEWVKVDGKTGRVGITHYAQEALGSVVFIDLPEEGARVAAGENMGVIESVKAASDYYTPVSGTVIAVNGDLPDAPELINEDPYGRGWIAEIELDNPAEQETLLDAEGYKELLAGEKK